MAINLNVLVLVAFSLLISLSGAAAVEAETSECLHLQTKLASLEEQLVLHKAQESKCVKDSEELEAKLRSASQQVEALQTKLASLESEASQLKESAKVAASAQAAAQSAEAKVQEVQSKLKAALATQQAQQEQLAAARQELQEVRTASSSLEALRLQYESEWLPFWIRHRSHVAMEAVGPALKTGQDLAAKYTQEGARRAHEMWSNHAKPSLAKVFSASKEMVEKHGGEWLPKIKAAAGAAQDRVKAVLESKQVSQLTSVAHSAAQQAHATLLHVHAELEAALVSLLGKSPNLVPLARKPYVTYFSYAIMGAPVLTLALPLLGRLVSGGGSRSEESMGAGGARGGGRAARRKRRV